MGDINGPGFCAFESEEKQSLSGNTFKSQQLHSIQKTSTQVPLLYHYYYYLPSFAFNLINQYHTIKHL